MTSVTMELVGVKDAIRELNKIGPGLMKEIRAEAKTIAQPAVDEAESIYNFASWGESHVKGVKYSWIRKGRQIGQFKISKAVKGIKVQITSRRSTDATILVTQFNVPAAVLETAGRRTKNRLGDALGSYAKTASSGAIKPGTSRVLGPAVYSKRKEIEDEFRKLALTIIRRSQGKLD